VETNVLPVAAMDVHELVEPVVPARAVRRRQKPRDGAGIRECAAGCAPGA